MPEARVRDGRSKAQKTRRRSKLKCRLSMAAVMSRTHVDARGLSDNLLATNLQRPQVLLSTDACGRTWPL